MRMEDQFDAVLYLGPPSSITIAPVSPARCADPNYTRMRLQRMALIPGGQERIEQLKDYCRRKAALVPERVRPVATMQVRTRG